LGQNSGNEQHKLPRSAIQFGWCHDKGRLKQVGELHRTKTLPQLNMYTHHRRQGIFTQTVVL